MATKNEFKTNKQSNFAIKYRPKLLKDLVGQEEIQDTIQSMVDNRTIHQSLLFQGESGHGKTTCARIVARYVNCQNLTEDDEGHSQPCGKCDSCKFDITNHPDVKELNVANARGIDDVRALIRETQMAPRFNFRVFILDEAHQLTKDAKELLLKPTEEPQDHIIWIFCTTAPEKFSATQRSRFMELKMKQLDELTCAKLLRRICKKEGVELSKEQLLTISRLTGASPRMALQALNKVVNNIKFRKEKDPKELINIIKSSVELPPYELATEYLMAVYRGDYSKALEIVEKAEAVVFMKFVLDFHYKATKFCINKKLCDFSNYFDRKLYDRVGKVSLAPDLMSFIMTKLIRVNSLVSEFQTDGKYLLGGATLEITEGVRIKQGKTKAAN